MKRISQGPPVGLRPALPALAALLLAGAPLLESRVCQYTCSPDGHLIMDRHPEAANAWLAGAGTGHAYKLGPAIGRQLAGLLLDGEAPASEFRIDRLGAASSGPYNQFDVRE